MTSISNFAAEIMKLVGQNELKAALERLRAVLQGSPLLNEAVGQSGRLTALMQQIRQGTISFEEANREENKLRFALLNLAQEMEERSEENQALKQQVEAVLNTSAAGKHNQLKVTGNNNIAIQDVRGSDIKIQTGGKVQNAEKIYNIDKIDRADFS
jgi:hypothetical protein